jgi:hypothetical protein
MPSSPTGGGRITPLCLAGVRSAAPRRFRVGPGPAGWSSPPYRAHHHLKRLEPSQARSRRPKKNQSGPYRAINCARATHASSRLPATQLLWEMAHTVDRTSVEYPRSPEKRAPTMPVGAYPLRPHGPHADRMEGPLFLAMGDNRVLRESPSPSQRRPQGLTQE